MLMGVCNMTCGCAIVLSIEYAPAQTELGKISTADGNIEEALALFQMAADQGQYHLDHYSVFVLVCEFYL